MFSLKDKASKLLCNLFVKAEEDIVIFINVLNIIDLDVLFDLVVTYDALVLNQEVLFHFLKALLVQLLSTHNEQRFPSKTALLNWQDWLEVMRQIYIQH